MPRRRAPSPVTWPQLVLYGAILAAGALALDWAQYQRFARSRAADIYLFLVGAGFLAIGLWVGSRLLARREPLQSGGNRAAQASLRISDRELDVLKALADALSNKEIGALLHISPHTVKTHVGSLYERLEARRRTEAIARARSLGILP